MHHEDPIPSMPSGEDDDRDDAKRLKLAVAILAGGASSRMGQDKATVLLNNERLLDRAVRRCALPGAPLYVLGAREPASGNDVRHIPDDRPGEGPLGALASLARRIDSAIERVFVTAVDMPMIDRQIALRFAEASAKHLESSAVLHVSSADGRVQPLPGLWSSRGLEVARTLFDRGERALRALTSATRYTALDERSLAEMGIDAVHDFRGVNSPEELEALRRALNDRDTP